jgi:hypothetical protein
MDQPLPSPHPEQQEVRHSITIARHPNYIPVTGAPPKSSDVVVVFAQKRS